MVQQLPWLEESPLVAPGRPPQPEEVALVLARREDQMAMPPPSAELLLVAPGLSATRVASAPEESPESPESPDSAMEAQEYPAELPLVALVSPAALESPGEPAAAPEGQESPNLAMGSPLIDLQANL